MLTRSEFARMLAYIAAGCPGAPPLSVESAEVYYDLLRDLPAAALMVAAKRAVLEHKYPNFPPVALIRQLAAETLTGQVKRLSAGEAWGIAMRAMANCDIEVPGSRERAFAKVPAIVLEAVSAFGFMAMYNLPNSAIETARAQFRGIYESIDDRGRKEALLPASVQKAIVSVSESLAMENRLGQIAGRIGASKGACNG